MRFARFFEFFDDVIDWLFPSERYNPVRIGVECAVGRQVARDHCVAARLTSEASVAASVASAPAVAASVPASVGVGTRIVGVSYVST